jgi:hypothetical protein
MQAGRGIVKTSRALIRGQMNLPQQEHEISLRRFKIHYSVFDNIENG